MAAVCRQALRRVLLAQPARSGVLAKPRIIRFSSTLQDDFEKAKERLNTLKDDPGNETKLKIYGLFKQVRQNALWTLNLDLSCEENSNEKILCNFLNGIRNLVLY